MNRLRKCGAIEFYAAMKKNERKVRLPLPLSTE
jgi:hypothetical protein